MEDSMHRSPVSRLIRLALAAVTLVLVGLGLWRTSSVPATAAAGVPVRFTAGWNLVAGPAGTVFNAVGPAYTLGPADSAYVSSAGDAPVSGGKGYWAYFPADTTVTLNGAGAAGFNVQAPAGQYLTIGNPSGVQAVTVSGADQVLIWDAKAGSYQAVTQLAVGQGAWALSDNGGALTLTANGTPLAIPTDTPTPSPTPSPTPPPVPVASGLRIAVRVGSCNVTDSIEPSWSSASFFSSTSFNGSRTYSAVVTGTAYVGAKSVPLMSANFSAPGYDVLNDLVRQLDSNGVAAAYDSSSNGGGILILVKPRVQPGTQGGVHLNATFAGFTASADQFCTFS
jgi:hypothetical protein